MSRNDEAAPEPEGEPPEEQGDAQRSQRIMRDEIKEQHTSHWDMDVMPRAEMEALFQAQQRRKRHRRMVMVAGVVGGIVAVGCAAALLLRYFG